MLYKGTVTNKLTNAPICGVTVTDGRHVVKTDEKGFYALPGWERSHTVAVCMLTNAHDDWYYYTGGKAGTYDFALTPADISAPFNILHTSDTEINNRTDLEWLDFFREKIREELPSFLIHTGDISSREGMLRHRAVMNYETMGCPVRYVVGNHDFVPSDADYGEQVFEQLYGPLWWSFDCGGVHCIVLSLGHGGRRDMPSGYPREDQWIWLQNELDTLAEGTKNVVFCHDAGPDAYEFIVGGIDLKQYGLLAWIYGHSHSNMHHVRNGVHNINTARPESGGIDSSVAGLRRIRIEDGKVSSLMHYRRFPTAPQDTPVWQTKLPGHITFGELIPYDGKLYIGTHRDGYPEKCGIFCIDPSDGHIIWQYETEGGFHSNLSVDEGLVYGQDCMGNTYCLNADDGKLQWKHFVRFGGGSLVAADRTRFPAFVAGDVVLVGSYAKTIALDKRTGAQRWEAERPKKAGHTPSRPLYDPKTERLYIGGQWGVLRCLDVKTGEVLWSNIERPIWYRTQTPCLVGKTIYTGGFGSMAKISAVTGEKLMEHNVSAEVKHMGAPNVISDGDMNACGAPVVEGSILYVPTAASGVIAMDRNTLQVLRRYGASPAGILSGPYVKKGAETVESCPVILGNTLLFTAADGKVYFYEKDTGKLQKTVNLPAPSLVAPVMGSGCFYTADFDGNICKWEMKL